MEGTHDQQLELFCGSQNSTAGAFDAKTSFWGKVRNHEKIILFLLALISIGVVSFCFGVEKGKNIASSKSNQRLDLAAAKEKAQALEKSVLPAAKQTPQKQPLTLPEKIAPAIALNTTGSFTVQVASFSSSAVANREAEKLKKKGLNALVVRKNKYSILCIGMYNNKKAAEAQVVQLKKTYKDCLVRRL